MVKARLDTLARTIWDYSYLNHSLKRCEAIFVLCSLDTRVAERAAQLYADGLGDYLIFSGGLGELSKDVFTKPEATVFADIAMGMGVPKENIITEIRSANTGQNIQFTYELLQERGLHPKSLILVQKPYMERRVYATFRKQWPDPSAEVLVTSPQIPYEEYFDDNCPKELFLNAMVGDLQRMREYPKMGFQIEQYIPEDVWDAYKELVALGYDKHLVS